MKGIFDAISEGDFQTIKQVVEVDAGVLNNSVGEFGESPLLHAISEMERQFEIIEFLVRSGADVNFATKEGYTPLHYNVDLNGPSGSGEMPYRVARLLKDHGADTEKRNHYGWTPLMRAALEGTNDEFKALIDIGAKYDVVYPAHSMPVFTRGESLPRISMTSPAKIQILLAAGFRPDLSFVREVKGDLAKVNDPDSAYAKGLVESLCIIQRLVR